MAALQQISDRRSQPADELDDSPCVNRKLAAILMADAVGFANRVQDDERATLAALREARRAIKVVAAAHCGRVVDTAGDSILAEFPSVVGAVAAAARFQSLSDAQPNGLTFRVGIHLGDVIVEPDGTIYGDGVNLAARLQSAADPGAILVSRAVCEAVKGKLPLEFRSRGWYALKNMRQRVRCFEVVTARGSAGWRLTSLARAKSLAKRLLAWAIPGVALVGTVAAACVF